MSDYIMTEPTLADRARTALGNYIAKASAPILEAIEEKVLHAASRGAKSVEEYVIELNYQPDSVKEYVLQSLRTDGLQVEIKFHKKLKWCDETKTSVADEDEDEDRIQYLVLSW